MTATISTYGLCVMADSRLRRITVMNAAGRPGQGIDRVAGGRVQPGAAQRGHFITILPFSSAYPDSCHAVQVSSLRPY